MVERGLGAFDRGRISQSFKKVLQDSHSLEGLKEVAVGPHTCLTRWPVIVAVLMFCASLLFGLVCTLSREDGQ